MFMSEVSRRKISQLVHFTTIDNLLSIFEQGKILSRERLKKLNIEAPELYLQDYLRVNDNLRIDNLNDHINLSIQHPNYYLFKRFRDSCSDWCNDWCVIALSPECIWHSETLFSTGNAASTVSKAQGIRGDIDAFCALFAEKVHSGNMRSKRVLCRDGLADCYPTDIQAEVLVKGSISIDYISNVYFEATDVAKRSCGAIMTISPSALLPPFIVNPRFFGAIKKDG